MRRLVELGMVSRRQGSGSQVIASTPRAAYAQSFASLTELFQFALDTHFVVQSVAKVTPPAAVQAMIGGVPGQEWRLLKGLRLTAPDGEPICWTHSYIPERLAWLVPELDPGKGPFYAHLEQHGDEPILEAVQEISGGVLDAETARALQRRPGSVGLCILRRYISANGTVIASFNWHPADGFVYRMHLQRTAAA